MIIFIAFSVLYILFLLWSRWHWMRIQTPQKSVQEVRFSIIVPIRNEQENIEGLLQSLLAQDYPKVEYEVIIINDQSEDDTHEVVNRFIQNNGLNWILHNVPSEESGGKKNAITKGVELAQFEYIVTTDGDCVVEPGWLNAYAAAYCKSEKVMVSAPVKMKGFNWFTRLQSIEFGGLIGIGAATLQSGNPTMCNGANLSYKKSVFEEVEGYKGNDNIPSGDDEFLLQKVFKKYPNAVSFLKVPEAIVQTDAKASLMELVNQRVRWSSKWKFHKSMFIKLMAMFIFMNYLSLIVGGLESFSDQALLPFIGVLFIRWLALLYFSYPLAQFFRISGVVWLSLLLEIIYPFFVIFLGIASIFAKYSWKGRYYS